jgi:endonuclease/exonuclease/phosphatase (EEP) superfamily protein YafD
VQTLETALTILGWLMVAATLVPLVRADYWAVRIFDFPRLQITAISVAILAGYLWVRDNPGLPGQILLPLLVVCVVYQLWRIWPYTFLHSRQVRRVGRVDAERTFSILISNVLMTNRQSGKLRALIRRYDPDVILTVESDGWWEQELAEFDVSHPHSLRRPQGNTYGMLLYSRLPLVDPRIRFLVQQDIPSMHTGLRLPSGEVVNLRCLHPRPPAPGENTRSAERDAELLKVARELADQDSPSVVVGDLNDVAWSHTNALFQKISGLLDPRVGRGTFSTFNANWPGIRFPVDHAFVSRHFRVGAFEVLPHMGSDHFPVFARLSVFDEAGAVSGAPPAPTAAEAQEAAEKIARAS